MRAATLASNAITSTPPTGTAPANGRCASWPTTPSDRATEPGAGSRQEENLPAADNYLENPRPESARFVPLL
jgi:hypothetical protein